MDNKKSKFIVVPDIHSDIKIVNELKKEKYEGIKKIFIGDLYDRGNNAKEVSEYINNNVTDDDVLIYGNHEDLLLKFINGLDALFLNEIDWKYIYYIFENDVDLTTLSILENNYKKYELDLLRSSMLDVKNKILTNLYFKSFTNMHLTKNLIKNFEIDYNNYLDDYSLIKFLQDYQKEYYEYFKWIKEYTGLARMVNCYQDNAILISHTGLIDDVDLRHPYLLIKHLENNRTDQTKIIGHFMLEKLEEQLDYYRNKYLISKIYDNDKLYVIYIEELNLYFIDNGYKPVIFNYDLNRNKINLVYNM